MKMATSARQEIIMTKVNNTVFVVDDDHDIRESLAILFDSAGYEVMKCSCGEDFLNIVTEDSKGCVVLDVDMPRMSGEEIHEELLRRNIHIPILFMTGYATVKLATHALRKGAIDCLAKPVPGWLLLERVEEAFQKSDDIQCREMHQRLASEAISTLSPREAEIMNLLVVGYSNKEVASMLHISSRTVENHRAHIMLKTQTSNLLELSSIARLAAGTTAISGRAG